MLEIRRDLGTYEYNYSDQTNLKSRLHTILGAIKVSAKQLENVEKEGGSGIYAQIS